MANMYDDVSFATMLKWFNENYEDAAHSVFYDGREGGYQYDLNAGPYDPLDVLKGEFPHANPDVVREAADLLLSSGSAWVKKECY